MKCVNCTVHINRSYIDKLFKNIDQSCNLCKKSLSEEIGKYSCDKTNLTEDFIKRYHTKLDWYYIITSFYLSEEFMREMIEMKEFRNVVSWDMIIQYQILSEQFLRELFENKSLWISMRKICKYQEISEKFIREYEKYIDFERISQYQNLSENFIRDYYYLLDWQKISQYQNLSENCIEAHQDLVDWQAITICQNLTEDFMERFANRIYWSFINRTKKIISDDLQQYIIKKDNWLYLTNDEKESLCSNFYDIVTIDNKKYIKCYKAVYNNYSSIYDPDNFVYDKLNIEYSTLCDYDANIENSFGFGCGTYINAKKYAENITQNFKILTIIVPLEFVCMTKSHKLRSSKMIVTNLNTVQ